MRQRDRHPLCAGLAAAVQRYAFAGF